MKAHPAVFAKAKKAVIEVVHAMGRGDHFVPDEIRFLNDEDGFIFRFQHGEVAIQRMTSWRSDELATIQVISAAAKVALLELAKGSAESAKT